MELVNETGLEAGWCLGFEADGRELVVVAVKATYRLPARGGELKLAEEQVPLTKADEFTGEPGFSATLYETDYSHRKPMCDVLVNGSAHAPNGKPAGKVTVGLKVGPIAKRIDVLGDRTRWRFLIWALASAPKPFVTQTISYDVAYGGTEVSTRDEKKARAYRDNPVGLGYHPLSRFWGLAGRRLANTQEAGKTSHRRNGKYAPMAFGAMGRNFRTRAAFAGTYDQKWLDERVPWWPDDFDYRYFQCVPEDQQMPFPKGGEEVELENLTPAKITRFKLPERAMPILAIPHEGDPVQLEGVIDTVLIEPDLERVMLTWRASLPMKKSCFDLKQVIIDRTLRQHRDAVRDATKTHYAGLGELIRDKQGARGV